MRDLMTIEQHCKDILRIADETYHVDIATMNILVKILEEFYYETDMLACPECWKDVLKYYKNNQED